MLEKLNKLNNDAFLGGLLFSNPHVCCFDDKARQLSSFLGLQRRCIQDGKARDNYACEGVISRVKEGVISRCLASMRGCGVYGAGH